MPVESKDRLAQGLSRFQDEPSGEPRFDNRARRHLLDLRRLEQFVSVVDLGSLTDAAAELGVTQQALSAAIRTLEKQLRVTLFIRTRGMQPSPAGLQLYESAQALLAGASRTVEDVQAAAEGRSKTLSIGYTPSMKSIHAYDLIGRTIAPDVPWRLEGLATPDLRDRMLAGDIDIALGQGVLPPEGFVGQVIGSLPVGVALRTEDAREFACGEVNLADLVDMRLIHCGLDTEAVNLSAVLTQCRAFGFEPHVEEIRPLGLDPVATPLVAERCFVFVTEDPGLYFGGRVTVLKLCEEIMLPVQAVWLPSAVNGPVGTVVGALTRAAAD